MLQHTGAVQRHERRAGIILHPTSLPGRHGIGDLGAGADVWLDFLSAAGARLWQILPLGPVGYSSSPYASRSTFAGDARLISLDHLVDDGLLSSVDVDSVSTADGSGIDHEAIRTKLAVLDQAYAGMASAPKVLNEEFLAFCQKESEWLDDWSLYCELSELYGLRTWTEWPSELAHRDPVALDRARRARSEGIDRQRFRQWIFHRQWHDLRHRANERGIQIMGDIPVFVAHDSVDVWAAQELFYLDAAGKPTAIAGVPPDYFSATGQRWGNPLYRWDVLAQRRYDWWVRRLFAIFRMVDLVRIDHFRGFESYWSIPAEAETAEPGHWEPGPGRALFDEAEIALGKLPIVVEDLGFITPEVRALREDLGYPGMAVLQFAFAGGPLNPYLPFHYQHNLVVYTGTHDNDTTKGWYAAAPEEERDAARRYLGTDGHDIAWDLIRLALSSVADIAVAPLQDLLGLGSEARMNRPGRPDGNWGWRVARDQLDLGVARRFADLIWRYGRSG